MEMMKVPQTPQEVIKQAKRCLVYVRCREDDIPLQVSKKQFRQLLRIYNDELSVHYDTRTQTAELEERGVINSWDELIRYTGATCCAVCAEYVDDNNFSDVVNDRVCYNCWSTRRHLLKPVTPR